MHPYNLLAKNLLDLLEDKTLEETESSHHEVLGFFNGDKSLNIVNTALVALHEAKKDSIEKYIIVLSAMANLPGHFYKELPQKTMEQFLVFLFNEEFLLSHNGQVANDDLEPINKNFLKLTNRVLSTNLFIGADFLYKHFDNHPNLSPKNKKLQADFSQFVDDKINHVKSYYIQGKFNHLLSGFSWYSYDSYRHDLLPFLSSMYINKELIRVAYSCSQEKQFIKKYKNDFALNRDPDEFLDNANALLELLSVKNNLTAEIAPLILDLIDVNIHRLDSSLSPYGKKRIFTSLINLSEQPEFNRQVISLTKNIIKQIGLAPHEMEQVSEGFNSPSVVSDFLFSLKQKNCHV